MITTYVAVTVVTIVANRHRRSRLRPRLRDGGRIVNISTTQTSAS